MPIFENRKKIKITQPYREWGGGSSGEEEIRRTGGKGSQSYCTEKIFIFMVPCRTCAVRERLDDCADFV